MDKVNAPPSPRAIHRHALTTRIWHWITAVSVIVLLGSGLMILNAHGQLYWGEYGANFDRPWFKLIWLFDSARVPGWLTIPSTYNLALARRWHLFFALVLAFALLAYMIVSLISGHFQSDLRIRARELKAAHLIADAKAHARLEFHDPANPRAYNIFQKMSYAGVIFVALPLAIFTGLAMSPGMNAAWPWLLDVFGGRQSARSIHFIVAMLLAGFIIVHLALVILAGPVNEVRSMITGKWRVPR
ncbi:cytochrome b/b6 domain-containing protein [Sphingomonas sp. MG17]|jgi:thiosulfate reductase cytochrome b subunit|uniref:Cytochrome b/b6 domain-containing protein n=1 Tax=Sphingomonas tagetis TaxID=2949092 RepID=A0A9X2HKV6_9SPHN|nr:cytochrome b/b6 domain-containing protein [Sphingomonas tagetis]MCP3729694.1 cytochrome b/b6 domain-containing protein [Sphingomonas tagetis]